MLPLRDRLAEAGWPAGGISMLAFVDPFGSNGDHDSEVAVAVELLRRFTGNDRVYIVAHSMGGLAVQRFPEEGGDPGVRRIVFLGTPHRGTASAMLAWGEGGREMAPGSGFLNRLNEASGSTTDVEMLTIRLPLDFVVIPRSSAILLGVQNLEICCPTHQGLLDDPEVFRQIEGFLLHVVEGLAQPDDRPLWDELRSLLGAKQER